MATPYEQLEAMRTVPDNWDGYGGFAPKPEAIDSAIHFYRQVETIRNLPIPYLGPTPNGGVQFDWDDGPHHLEVAFEPERNGTLKAEFLYDNTLSGDVISGTIRNSKGIIDPSVPIRKLVVEMMPAAA